MFLALSPSMQALNSFPKVFGGDSGDSYLYHIDVYNDYLAMVGGTCDNSLTGISSCVPYIVLQSVGTAGKIYWAKANSLKAGKVFGGVQFSNDGALLIAHSIFYYDDFIVVFKTSSGAILSARKYLNIGT